MKEVQPSATPWIEIVDQMVLERNILETLLPVEGTLIKQTTQKIDVCSVLSFLTFYPLPNTGFSRYCILPILLDFPL